MNLVCEYDDVNMAYRELQTIKKHFVQPEETRNGLAYAFQGPVCVTHVMPYRRVLFDPIRDANPFFHYLEAIWMLAGGNNLDWPNKFASNMKQYSDNGISLHGAYGFRWRHHFEIDQIDEVIERFKKDPFTRRAVISMWDPVFDANYTGKDLPCNTHIYFRNQDNRLHMTVCNRSNDLVWGMLGSNIVTFAVLQEYIANSLTMSVGALHQFTNNLHVYKGWEDRFDPESDDWYKFQDALPRVPFSDESFSWQEAEAFIEYGDIAELNCKILRQNAWPMYQAWEAYKDDDLPLAMHYAIHIYDADWQKACVAWIDRRILKEKG